MLLSITLHLILYGCGFNSYCHSVMWQSLNSVVFWRSAWQTDEWVLSIIRLLWGWHDKRFIHQLLFHHWKIKNSVFSSILKCGWYSLSLLTSSSFESAPFGIEQIFALVKIGKCLGCCFFSCVFWFWYFFCDWKAQTEVFWDSVPRDFIDSIQNFFKKQAFLCFHFLTSVVLWHLCLKVSRYGLFGLFVVVCFFFNKTKA